MQRTTHHQRRIQRELSKPPTSLDIAPLLNKIVHFYGHACSYLMGQEYNIQHSLKERKANLISIRKQDVYTSQTDVHRVLPKYSVLSLESTMHVLFSHRNTQR